MSKLQLQTSCENLLLPNEDDEGGFSPRVINTKLCPEEKSLIQEGTPRHFNWDMDIPKNFVQIENPNLVPVVPLEVRVGFTLYDVCPFDVANSRVDVTFDLWLVYNTKTYAKTFGGHCERLPWTMPNAVSLEITRHRVYHQPAQDLQSFHFWAKQQEFLCEDDELQLFTVEAISCRGTLKLTTFPHEDPFQSVYMVIKLALDGTPGSERTQYLPPVLKDPEKCDEFLDCYFPGARDKMADYVKGQETVRQFRINCVYGEYSRIYCIFEYKKSPLEDIAKYYVLPALINLLTILFYDDADSLFDSAGTYFLAIIALLFTMPETGSFTRSERSIVVGSCIMLVNLVLLIYDPCVIVQVIWWVAVFCMYAGLLAFDFYRARKVNEKYKKILFEGDLTHLDVI